MKPTAQLHEVRRMRFLDVWGRFDRKELTVEQAIDLLSVSRSTFYRMRCRYASEGEEGLIDHRVGKASPRQIPVDRQMELCLLYKTHYCGWTVKHFHEQIARHGFCLAYTTVKNILQANGVVQKAPKKGKHRRKRVPKPMRGMMIHQDASTHEWVEGKIWDLVVTMDDATNEVYSIFFCNQEGTASSFKGLSETIKLNGLPCSLYTDRGSHYFYTPKAGEKVSKTQLTQVGRALSQLGIQHIPADSPQARGRSERVFRTLQDRLPKELKLRGITDMDAANIFLRDCYKAMHNKRFAHEPELAESAFTSPGTLNLDDILCIQEERTVANDNTVSYKGQTIQLGASKQRVHYVRCKVIVHEYADGSLAVFHGPRKLETAIVKSKAERNSSVGFIASEPKLDMEKAEEVAPSPASNFGCHSALGSLPSVALSSE